MIDHLALAAAHWTHGKSILRLGARSLATRTRLHAWHQNIGAHPAHRSLEPDFQIIADILASLRPVLITAATAAPEQVVQSKEIAQDVAKIGERFG